MAVPFNAHRFSRPAAAPATSALRPNLPRLSLTLLVGLIGSPATAQPDTPTTPAEQRPAKLWAAEAAAAELRALNHAGPYLRYRMHLVDRRGDKLRDEIETPDGTVARLVQRDGHALTPDEDAAERARLNALISSPDDFFKHIRSERSERKMAADLIGLLPDAMLYTYVPGQPQLPNLARRQVVLDYSPNPQWTPPSTTAEALTGIRGRLWIDADAHTTVRLEGNIFRPINIGWGMVAHIYPGGTFTVDQTNPGNGPRWIYTHFEQTVTVRALMLKSLEVNGRADTSDFQQVPGMGYADAIRLLLSTPPPTS